MKFAIKLNKNSYYPLCCEFLDIMATDDNLDSLENIDKFTSKFFKQEIIESIIRSNVLSQDYLKLLKNDEETDFFRLVIIYNDNGKTRELFVYTRDDSEYIDFDVYSFINNMMNDLNLMNQIYSFLSSKNYLSQELQNFNLQLKFSDNIEKINEEYSKLSYVSKRFLKTYFYKIYEKKLNDSKLKLKNE